MEPETTTTTNTIAIEPNETALPDAVEDQDVLTFTFKFYWALAAALAVVGLIVTLATLLVLEKTND